MTKEELLAKLKAIDATLSPTERVKMLAGLNEILKDANRDLKDVYAKAKADLDAAKS
ncbi:MAG: hypothetical protein HY975_02525 [Candidatus Kerfeldbacteria bacterium]|nr:hypothetical protein [Candidatus Kerfeldbacteria bacterium]